MDLTLVDVTDVTAAAPGDPVVVFGETQGSDEEGGGRDAIYADTLAAAVDAVAGGQGLAQNDRQKQTPHQASSRVAPPTVEEIAAWAETIPHEILSRIAPRVPRRYLDSTASGRAMR